MDKQISTEQMRRMMLDAFHRRGDVGLRQSAANLFLAAENPFLRQSKRGLAPAVTLGLLLFGLLAGAFLWGWWRSGSSVMMMALQSNAVREHPLVTLGGIISGSINPGIPWSGRRSKSTVTMTVLLHECPKRASDCSQGLIHRHDADESTPGTFPNPEI